MATRGNISALVWLTYILHGQSGAKITQYNTIQYTNNFINPPKGNSIMIMIVIMV